MTTTSVIPKPTQHLVGRTQVVNSMVDALTMDKPARLAVLGTCGIGKTTVALAVLNDPRVKVKFDKNRIFLRCDGVDTASAILTSLASAIHGRAVDSPSLSGASLLEPLEGSKLLVLDNLESAWQTSEQEAVEDLLRDVTGVTDLSMLITMRGALRPVTVQWSQPFLPQLQPLLLSDSKLMYLSISGREDDESLDELLELLGGLPLAIELMANQGQTSTPAELLQSYHKEKTSLLKRGTEATRLTSLAVSIEVSLKSPPMTNGPEALELLSMLALLPEGLAVDDNIWKALPKFQKGDEAMRALQQVALASKTELTLGWWPVLYVLPPIRDFLLYAYPCRGRSLQELCTFYIMSETVTPSFDNFHSLSLHVLQTGFSVSDLAWAVAFNMDYIDMERHLQLLRGLLHATSDWDRPDKDRAKLLHHYAIHLPKSDESLASQMLGEAQAMHSALGMNEAAMWDLIELARRAEDSGRNDQVATLFEGAKQLVDLDNRGRRYDSLAPCFYYSFGRFLQRTHRFPEAKSTFFEGLEADRILDPDKALPATWSLWNILSCASLVLLGSNGGKLLQTDDNLVTGIRVIVDEHLARPSYAVSYHEDLRALVEPPHPTAFHTFLSHPQASIRCKRSDWRSRQEAHRKSLSFLWWALLHVAYQERVTTQVDWDSRHAGLVALVAFLKAQSGIRREVENASDEADDEASFSQ